MSIKKSKCEKVFSALNENNYKVTPGIKRAIASALAPKKRKPSERNLFIRAYAKKHKGLTGPALMKAANAAWYASNDLPPPLPPKNRKKSVAKRAPARKSTAKKAVAKKPAAKKSAAKKSSSSKSDWDEFRRNFKNKTNKPFMTAAAEAYKRSKGKGKKVSFADDDIDIKALLRTERLADRRATSRARHDAWAAQPLLSVHPSELKHASGRRVSKLKRA